MKKNSYIVYIFIFLFVLILFFISIFVPYFKIGSLNRDLSISILTTILSSLISTLGVIITIKYTKEQFDKDKRIQVKPHLNISLESSSCENTLADRVLNRTMVIFSKNNPTHIYINGKNNDEDRSLFNTIKIQNIGMGPIINFKLNSIESNKREIEIIPKSTGNKIVFIDNIKNGDSIELELTIDIPTGSPGGNNLDRICEEILLNIEYQDILYNKYEYNLYFETFISMVSTNLITQSYQISSNLLYDKCTEHPVKKS